jgi:hypothetical protein
MFWHSALLGCAALAFMTLPAVADAPQSARCEEMSFRVYFDHGSTALDPMAMQTIAFAESRVAGCAYAEMHVRVDPGARYARARWNVARIEPRDGVQRASLSNGPDFAEVLMTPRVLPQTPTLTDRNVGV